MIFKNFVSLYFDEINLSIGRVKRFRLTLKLNLFFQEFYGKFGMPGGGAPLKTESGQLQANIVGDPMIRFQENKESRATINNTLRYNNDRTGQSQYGKILGT